MHILPSAYQWLLPDSLDIKSINNLVQNGEFPSVLDLYPAVILAFIFGFGRIILHNLFFKKIAIIALNLTYSNQPIINEIDHILSQKQISDEVYLQLSDITGLKVIDIKRYNWNKHRDEVSNRKLTKFTEALWRAVFYSCFCIFGIITLSTSETNWIGDTKEHWNNWPHHRISSLMNLYYQMELGCYLHQLYWTEVVRSDALEMILHHIITIILIVTSYLTNFTRIGCSILVLHDFGDIFLEVAKCFNYMTKVKAYKYFAQPITDSTFSVFAVSFAITRLYIYPRYLVYSLLYEAPEIMGMWSGYWLFATMLTGLQFLHVFWFILILRMVWKLIFVGECGQDVRESDEEDNEIEFIDHELSKEFSNGVCEIKVKTGKKAK